MPHPISVFAQLFHYDDPQKETKLGLESWFRLFNDLTSRFNLKQRGIGFGFEVHSVDWFSRNNFDPKTLRGFPYSIHMPGQILSRLYFDNCILRGTAWFDHYLEWFDTLDPKPIAVIFHGPRYIAGNVILLDDRRYELKIEPQEMFKMRAWMMELFSNWNKKFPVYLENLSITEFAGPFDYGKYWAPLTYTVPQIGTHPMELRRYNQRYQVCNIALDLSHLVYNCRFHRNIEEYEFLRARKRGIFLAQDKFGAEFGYEYEVNGPVIDNYLLMPSEAIGEIRADYVHINGSHQEILPLGLCQYPPDTYLDQLNSCDCFTSEQLMSFERNRIASHAPISKDDNYLRFLLETAIHYGASTLVVEVASHTPDDCWWLATDHDPEISLTNLVHMLCFAS